MPLFPRFVPQNTQPTMDLQTLLSLLGDSQSNSAQYNPASSSSHQHQSPTHASTPSVSHPAAPRPTQSRVTRAFTPNFDIFETATEYVLEGELPGLSDKRAVEIEFTDGQTLLVKGRIEKIVHTPSSSSPSSAAPSDAKQITVSSEEETKPEEHHQEHPRPHTPPKPTVEDDVDEDDDSHSTAIMTPTTSASTSTVTTKAQQQVQTQTKTQSKEQIRYWVSERTIGAFQRTFSFPGLIDQDGVKAKLENGLLTVVVPKRVQRDIRRIEVQ